MKRLDVQSLKYQYAALYGQLVTEWLSAEKKDVAAETPSDDAMEGFEEINTAARDSSRVEWEELVFEACQTDEAAIAKYLRNLFGKNGENKQAIKALEELRKEVETFEIQMSTPGQFNEAVLRWTINGLLSSNLLSEEKNAVLKDFLASSIILRYVHVFGINSIVLYLFFSSFSSLFFFYLLRFLWGPLDCADMPGLSEKLPTS